VLHSDPYEIIKSGSLAKAGRSITFREVLIAMQIPKVDPLMGIQSGLKAFVAAVLGGIGSIPGAVLGGMLLGASEVMVTGYWSSTYRDAIAFAILILVLLLRPQGILGRVEKEKV
jgi:branched-chain amino acid transport system permease protein